MSTAKFYFQNTIILSTFKHHKNLEIIAIITKVNPQPLNNLLLVTTQILETAPHY